MGCWQALVLRASWGRCPSSFTASVVWELGHDPLAQQASRQDHGIVVGVQFMILMGKVLFPSLSFFRKGVRGSVHRSLHERAWLLVVGS